MFNRFTGLRSAIFSLNFFSSFASEEGDCETFFEKFSVEATNALEKISSESIRRIDVAFVEE